MLTGFQKRSSSVGRQQGASVDEMNGGWEALLQFAQVGESNVRLESGKRK